MDTIFLIIIGIVICFIAYKTFNNVPAYLTAVIADTLSGKFIANKWHKHAIIATIGASVLFLILKYFLHSEGVSDWVLAGITIFVGFIACWLFEGNQNVQGAHQGKAGELESKKDIVVGDIFVVVGTVITALIA